MCDTYNGGVLPIPPSEEQLWRGGMMFPFHVVGSKNSIDNVDTLYPKAQALKKARDKKDKKSFFICFFCQFQDIVFF